MHAKHVPFPFNVIVPVGFGALRHLTRCSKVDVGSQKNNGAPHPPIQPQLSAKTPFQRLGCFICWPTGFSVPHQPSKRHPLLHTSLKLAGSCHLLTVIWVVASEADV